MRRVLILSIGILLTLIGSDAHLASSSASLNIPVATSQGVTATISMVIDDTLGQFTVQQSGAQTTYTDGNYVIDVTETGTKSKSILHVVAKKASGEAFRVENFSVMAEVSQTPIQGIWYPGADPSSSSVMAADANQPINDVSDANFGIPYIAAASSNSKNVFAMGLGRQDFAVSIGGQPLVPLAYQFRLNALTPRTTATFDERVFISADSSLTWFEAAADYASWVDALNKYQPFPVSPTAYEPMYDAWYWAGDAVNDQVYHDTAAAASQLGMGLYLADAGWDTDTGEWLKWLAGKTGDYTPPPSKFTNLAQTFSNIRAQDNLGIDLWLQPFAVGRQSFRYPDTSGMHIQLPLQPNPVLGWEGLASSPFTLPLGDDLEDVNLCPRMSSTATYLKNLFSEVAAKYAPDGYWLDFMDGMPTYCVADHHHDYQQFGEGFKNSLEAIKSTILSYNPNAIVHFRARYANLNNKSYASVWQSGDSPADYDRMRLNSIRLHPFSNGVVFAADQLYWPDTTSEPEVSKFIMTSVMVGVPAFGASLLTAPPSTLQMIKAWLDFYRSNKLDIATGKFSPFGPLNMPNHKIEGQSQTYAYIRSVDSSAFTANSSTVFLMNATTNDQLTAKVRVPQGHTRYSATILDRFLQAEPGQIALEVNANAVVNVNLAVEQGGMVVLQPTTENSIVKQTRK
jgi:hypothetical protein